MHCKPASSVVRVSVDGATQGHWSWLCLELVWVWVVSMKFESGLDFVEKLWSILTILISDILGPLLSIIMECLCVSLLNLQWCDLLYSQERESVLYVPLQLCASGSLALVARLKLMYARQKCFVVLLDSWKQCEQGARLFVFLVRKKHLWSQMELWRGKMLWNCANVTCSEFKRLQMRCNWVVCGRMGVLIGCCLLIQMNLK